MPQSQKAIARMRLALQIQRELVALHREVRDHLQAVRRVRIDHATTEREGDEPSGR